MFEAARRLMLRCDIVRLLDMVIFDLIACNTDVHAKNDPIMIKAGGASPAPLYDVVCGQVRDTSPRTSSTGSPARTAVIVSSNALAELRP
jgi:serine/threonine protein kinase HipA of HipAB toxin-antitoxin module